VQRSEKSKSKMDGKFLLILAAASVIFAESIPSPLLDRSTKRNSDRQSLDQEIHSSSEHSHCSSPPCRRPHWPRIKLENKLQKARRILRLLEKKSQHSKTLVERLPEAQHLKTVPLKEFSSQEYSKGEVDPTEKSTVESSDESPEKWFIPIDPRPYKSPDNSPETWFKPIVPKAYKSPEEHSKDAQADLPMLIPSELSVDVTQETQTDSNEADIQSSLQEESILEPITLLALKIFNSLPKPRSKENKLEKNEEKKSVDNRSEPRDGEKEGVLLSGDSAPQSKVALPESKEEQQADEENVNKKGFERDVNLRESILAPKGSVNINFGEKISGPPSKTAGYSNTDRDNGEKIRFRPRKNYLSQLLRHTQDLGLVQKLGNIFTLFPERKGDLGSTQSGEHSISPPTWIKKMPAEKESSTYLSKKTPEPSVLLQQPNDASLLPRQPPMQIQGQPVKYMH